MTAVVLPQTAPPPDWKAMPVIYLAQLPGSPLRLLDIQKIVDAGFKTVDSLFKALVDPKNFIKKGNDTHSDLSGVLMDRELSDLVEPLLLSLNPLPDYVVKVFGESPKLVVDPRVVVVNTPPPAAAVDSNKHTGLSGLVYYLTHGAEAKAKVQA